MSTKFDYATPFSKSSSGFRGVSFDRHSGRWVAKISYNGARTNLGYFDTPEDAHEAYKEASAVIRPAAEAARKQRRIDRVHALLSK